MGLNLTELLPSNWLHALATTLFHSLWIGVILALVVAIVLFSTRKTSAVIRYNLLTASLCVFVVAVGMVFFSALKIEVLETKAISTAKNMLPITEKSSPNIQTDIITGINTVAGLWNSYTAQIVLSWFLVICIKSVQFFAGLTAIHQLKRTKTYSAGKKWDSILATLSMNLGIGKSVRILQSGIATVPMVVGHFKPLILIPLGLLNSLSADEVEAILCHELAHIKRRDYLVNLLQSFIEIVFFFNPAVLWVSKLIKEERENCCDDLAISKMDNKRNYVKALITCQEFQLKAPAFALAVTGEKNHLFNRISRMLFDTKTTLNKMEKTILTLALVSVVICSAAFKNVASSGEVNPANELRDTIKRKNTRTEIARKQTIENKKQAIEDSKQAIRDAKVAIEDGKIAAEDAKHAAEDAKVAEADAKVAKLDALQAQIDAKIAAEDAKMQRNENLNRNNSSRRGHINPPSAPVSPVVPPSPPVHQSTPPLPPLNRNNGQNAPGTSTKTGTQTTIESATSTNSDVHEYKAIISEMLQDGIIKNSEKLSYKLDKNNLIINGVKQPNNYHQKYKKKYLQSDNAALLYRFETNSTTVTAP